MVGIVIPTMNRPDFVIRQLAYYADVGYRHTVYVGDSSEPVHVEEVTRAVRRLQGRINIVHIRLPGLNDSQAIKELLYCVKEPYAAFVGDDDFLAAASLERCARFLEAHPDYSTAHGVAAIFGLASSGAHGEIAWWSRYGQRAVEHASATKRLIDYLGTYYVTLFSVHRTEDFRREMDAPMQVSDRAFRGELLPGCLSIIRGKAKELDCLSLIRQAHDRRYLMPDAYGWIANPDWLPSYQIFSNCLAEELSQRDGITLEQAREVVKQAFWSYLNRGLMKHWRWRYGKNSTSSGYSWRDLARAVPGLRGGWRKVRSLLPGNNDPFSLEAMMRPSSPYHEDFMPIYRAITTLPAEFSLGRNAAAG